MSSTFEKWGFVSEVIRRLHLVAAASLLVFGFAGIYLSRFIDNPYALVFPLAGALGGVLYLVSRTSTNAIDVGMPTGVRFEKVLNVSLLVLLSAYVSLFYAAGFNRTWPIHLTTALLYVVVTVYGVLYYDSARPLLWILIVGIAQRSSAYYTTDWFIGLDVFIHQRWVIELTQVHHLQEVADIFRKYYYAPFYHVLTSTGNKILSTATHETSVVVTLLTVTIVPTLAVYVIVEKIHGKQAALLGSVLFIASDYAIAVGIRTTPTSIGIVFYSLFLMALVSYYLTDSRRHLALVVFAIVALTLTHQISLFIAFYTLTFFLLFSLVFKRKYVSMFNLSVLTGIVQFLSWSETYYLGPEGPKVSFFERMTKILLFSIMAAGVSSRSEFQLPADPNINATGAAALTPIHVAGVGFLLATTVAGSLHFLEQIRADRRERVGFALAGLSGSMLLFTLGGPLIGMSLFVPTRWFPFVYLPMAILGGIALLRLLEAMLSVVTSAKFTTLIVLIVVVSGPYFVLMGGNAQGSVEDPLFGSAPGAERLSYTESEQQLFEWVSRHSSASTTVSGDTRIYRPLRYYGQTSQAIEIEYGNPNSLVGTSPTLIVDRAYIHTNKAVYLLTFDDVTLLVHGEIPVGEINPTYRSVVYDTGEDEVIYLLGRTNESTATSRDSRTGR